MKDNVPYINIHTHKMGGNEISIEIIGIHPFDAESGVKLTAKDIDESIEAIGEIGLDFAKAVDRTEQERVFKEQLSLSEQLNLPVVIHSVRAVDRTIDILSQFRLNAVIFHGFIGSEQQANMAIKRGYYLSFGHRCFASPKTLSALRMVPLERLFFETDECDISIEEIYSRAAAYRGESLSAIKEQLYINYINIFKRK
ncbi:MAG: TatD family hydrolase [Rikenellaceae bacterium]